MKVNSLSNSLPQMNTETSKRDKALEKIATAVELKLEDSSSRTIADMMQNQISSLSQGLMNANDGISMLQIADGALSSLSDQTQTLNDLSVRNNSAILNSADKQALNSQFQRTLTSMQNIVNTTSYNGNPLFNNNFSISIGDGTLSASIANVSPKGLSIDNQEGINQYAQTLASAQSDVGSATNNFISSTNVLLQQITDTAVAKSQIADTDMAKQVSEFQQSNNQISAGLLTMAHQTDTMRQSMARLLG